MSSFSSSTGTTSGQVSEVPGSLGLKSTAALLTVRQKQEVDAALAAALDKLQQMCLPVETLYLQ